MKVFYVIIFIILIWVILNYFANLYSKKDAQRIMKILRIYKKSKKANISGKDLIKQTIIKYNDELFSQINSASFPNNKLLDNLEKGGIRNMLMTILLLEDMLIFKKDASEIKKNKDVQEKIIDDIYEKWSMKEYENTRSF